MCYLFFNQLPTSLLPSLDSLAKGAEIVTAGTLVLALLSYFYQRNQDKTKAVADQISFCTEKLLPKHEEFLTLVRNKKGNPKYVFRTVKLDTPTLRYVRDNFFDASKDQAELAQIPEVFAIETTIINYLEELAIRIVHFGTLHHEAINSIKDIFVQLVELHGTILLMHKEFFTSGKTFSYTLKLYQLWKDQVDRTPPDLRIQAFIASLKK